jgi:predicted DsbA family dithiol-disulfide isomerase
VRGTPETPLTVDIVSDVMCPWCYIGKRRFERAIMARPDVTFDVRWRAFKLDPTIPKGGVDREEYLSNKFGGADRASAIYAQIEQAGADEGLPFAFSGIQRSPNTTDPHRLIRWSYGAGQQDGVVEELFEAFFMHGADIEDHDVLVDIGERNGMDPALLRELMESERDVDSIDQELAHARQLGIEGVPCFVFAGRVAVMGAQEPQGLLEAIDKALTLEDDAGSAVEI